MEFGVPTPNLQSVTNCLELFRLHPKRKPLFLLADYT